MRTTILVWKNCPLKIKITNWGQYKKKTLWAQQKLQEITIFQKIYIIFMSISFATLRNNVDVNAYFRSSMIIQT